MNVLTLLDMAATGTSARVGVERLCAAGPWGQDIAAAVVFRPGHTASTEELRQWTRTRLRGSKTPALIVVRDALPQTATGKVLRRELLADLLATELAPTP